MNASIVNTSGGSFLTLTAAVAGDSILSLKAASDGSGTDLLGMTNTGSVAKFEVNGRPATSTSNQVTGVIPGVTLTLKALTTGTQTATVSVSGNAASIATALQTIVGTYNALSSSMAALTAPATGALIGSQEIRSVQNLMRGFAFYKGTGSIGSLMDLGVSVDKFGVMSIDATKISAMTPGQLAGVMTFIGDGTTGISAQSKGLSAFSDTISGPLQQYIAQDQAGEQHLQDQIDAMNVRIQLAQQTVMAKLQAADSMLAMLTNQQSILTSSIQSLNFTLNFTLYGVQTSSGSSS